MLRIVVPGREGYNESTNEFFSTPETTLDLEHSLIAISKWEMKYRKPFLDRTEKTAEEMLYYIKCMTITKVKDQSCYDRLTEENVKEIKEYIENPMTATRITKSPGDGKKTKTTGGKVTSELVYWWLVQLNIPFEVEKWHFNRLMMLIDVGGEKTKKPKKVPRKQNLRNQASLNRARRKASGSTG